MHNHDRPFSQSLTGAPISHYTPYDRKETPREARGIELDPTATCQATVVLIPIAVSNADRKSNKVPVLLRLG